jgi:hypothetical protein
MNISYYDKFNNCEVSNYNVWDYPYEVINSHPIEKVVD